MFLFLGFSADVNIWPDKQIVPRDGGAAIYCASYSKLPIWYFNGRRLSTVHTRVAITNVQSHHEGTYVCNGWTMDQKAFKASSTLVVQGNLVWANSLILVVYSLMLYIKI